MLHHLYLLPMIDQNPLCKVENLCYNQEPQSGSQNLLLYINIRICHWRQEVVATAQQNPLLKVSTICRCIFLRINSKEREGSALPENFFKKMLGNVFLALILQHIFLLRRLFLIKRYTRNNTCNNKSTTPLSTIKRWLIK